MANESNGEMTERLKAAVLKTALSAIKRQYPLCFGIGLKSVLWTAAMQRGLSPRMALLTQKNIIP